MALAPKTLTTTPQCANDYSFKGFKENYDHIQDSVMPNISEDDCPPLQDIIYNIRMILQPELNFLPRIMDLLALLSNVEQTWQLLVHVAHEALELNERNKLQAKPMLSAIPLGPDLETDIKKMVKFSQTILRPVFRRIIDSLAQLDIHEILRASQDCDESQSNEIGRTLQTRLRLYFQVDLEEDTTLSAEPNNPNERTLQHLFQVDLSPKEQVELNQAADNSVKLIENVSHFARDPEDYCLSRTLKIPLDKATFLFCFPSPVQESKVIALISHYTDGVLDGVRLMRKVGVVE